MPTGAEVSLARGVIAPAAAIKVHLELGLGYILALPLWIGLIGMLSSRVLGVRIGRWRNALAATLGWGAGLVAGLIALGPDYERSMAASIPLKKLGTVEDIGHTALFLASKEAAYITGQTIIVDGGQIIPESMDALTQA